MADGPGDLSPTSQAPTASTPLPRVRESRPPHDSRPPEALNGTYRCVSCDAALFLSAHRIDLRDASPAFYQPADTDAVVRKPDFRMVLPRTGVHCAACGVQLGHVFKDGPAPTGLRFSIDPAALRFRRA